MRVIHKMDSQDLKRVGLKVTQPRRLVLETIRTSSERHLSAEDVHRRLLKQGGDVGLGTVYRVLAQLESAGLLSRNVFESGKPLYEIKEGGDHDHLLCLGCGRVDEFRNQAIGALRQDVAETHKYRLTRHSLVFYGYCPDCAHLHQSDPNQTDETTEFDPLLKESSHVV